MNTRIPFRLAAVVLAVAATFALVETPSLRIAEASPRILDLPAVIVHPAVEDAAYYQAHKIVDLEAVTVYPDVSDLAFFVADTTRRVDCLSC